MVNLELKELHFLGSLVDISDSSFLISDLLSFNTSLKFNDLVFLSSFLILQVFDLFLKIILAMLGQKLLSHCESHSALVKSLISSISHIYVVSDSQEE